jgi:hypothetical protein
MGLRSIEKLVLDKKDIAILHSVRDYFGVGSVYSSPNRSLCLYRVNKIDDLINVIIPHFVDYPLLTKKYSDFVLWSKVVNIISNKEHLTPTGFNTILTYYASINKGMTPKVSSQFPNIVGVEKVENNALNSSMELHPGRRLGSYDPWSADNLFYSAGFKAVPDPVHSSLKGKRLGVYSHPAAIWRR